MLFINFVVCVTLAFATAQEECHNWSSTYFEHLGTKTPYRLVGNKNDSRLVYHECKPIKIWMMVRHGTRYSGGKFMDSVFTKLVNIRDEIISGFDEGMHNICENVVKGFEKWAPYLDYSKNKHLAHEGEEEMVELAERFQRRFPELFPKLHSSKYKFRSTDKQRTKESMRNFLIGLFGRKTAMAIWPLPSSPLDTEILRFYKLCPRWKRDVDDNPLSLLEKLKFEDTEDWWDMTRNISARLGLDYVIDQESLHTMYTLCAFETAWHRKKLSPWCALFTKEELAAFEYGEDLEYYHIDGYGYPLNYLQACPAIQDLMKHMTLDDGTITSVSFSHSGTILKLMTHLGLYNDSSSAWRKNPNLPRLWRVSKIDAFGSNIAFVLHECGNEKKFQVLHQERPVTLDGCPQNDLCPLEVLVKAHGGSLTNCRFKEMCTIPPDNEV